MAQERPPWPRRRQEVPRRRQEVPPGKQEAASLRPGETRWRQEVPKRRQEVRGARGEPSRPSCPARPPRPLPLPASTPASPAPLDGPESAVSGAALPGRTTTTTTGVGGAGSADAAIAGTGVARGRAPRGAADGHAHRGVTSCRVRKSRPRLPAKVADWAAAILFIFIFPAPGGGVCRGFSLGGGACGRRGRGRG